MEKQDLLKDFMVRAESRLKRTKSNKHIIWTGRTHRLTIRGEKKLVEHWLWQLTHGGEEVGAPFYVLRKTCGRPDCVNPAHHERVIRGTWEKGAGAESANAQYPQTAAAADEVAAARAKAEAVSQPMNSVTEDDVLSYDVL